MIGYSSVLSSGSVIGSACNLGDGVQVGSGATVSNGVSIFNGATVAASATQSEDVVFASFIDGTTALPSWPSGANSGSVSFSVCGNESSSWSGCCVAASGHLKNGQQPGEGHATSDERYGSLRDHVGSDIARPKYGGSGTEYDALLWNCNSYSAAMDAKLSPDFTVTFTTIRHVDPAHKWCWVPDSKRWDWAHSLADVHWNDGKITWIDAQLKDWEGIDPLEVMGEQFDNNDDGVITYSDGVHTDEATDGDLSIEVYDSRQDAEAAWGTPFPGG
jgi:hypothetical protein